ncbi:hypothetical protein [Deinococcus saxicola]|uniref:hypothetical protein n=1 Tax=Deinococcus saxicola TaxID=249406 RepID=UPI0039EF0CB9
MAGLTYVMGALGFELLEGLVVSGGGTDHPLNQSLIVVEEGMEMLGVTLFISALLNYLRTEMPGLRLRLSIAPTEASGD